MWPHCAVQHFRLTLSKILSSKSCCFPVLFERLSQVLYLVQIRSMRKLIILLDLALRIMIGNKHVDWLCCGVGICNQSPWLIFHWSLYDRFSILLPKLFWPTVRKNCFVIEKNFWNSRLKTKNMQTFRRKHVLCPIP